MQFPLVMKDLLVAAAALAALTSAAPALADTASGTSDSGLSPGLSATDASGAPGFGGEPLQGDRPADEEPAHKQLNLAANPVALLVGWIDVEAQVAVSDRLAISGSFAIMTLGETTGMGAALTVPYYSDRVFSGGFIEPGVVAYRFDNDSVVAGPQLSVGWRWMSEGGYTLGIAVGATVIEETVLPQGYFRTGYAF